MKKYHKPQVKKVLLAVQEQVLTFCKGDQDAKNPECWADFPSIPNHDLYPPPSTG